MGTTSKHCSPLNRTLCAHRVVSGKVGVVWSPVNLSQHDRFLSFRTMSDFVICRMMTRTFFKTSSFLLFLFQSKPAARFTARDMGPPWRKGEGRGERVQWSPHSSFPFPSLFPSPFFPFLPEEKFHARRLLSPCANGQGELEEAKEGKREKGGGASEETGGVGQGWEWRQFEKES